MKQNHATSKDLALLVHRKLIDAKTPHELPKIEVLTEIFETLFYTSLKTEESQFLKVMLTYLNPESPDQSPNQILNAKRWQCTKFENPIPFRISELVKLSKAADVWSSSLAVFSNIEGEVFIWGMIDQAIHSQSFLSYETFDTPEQPGLFQASIKGIGFIEVMFECELIASLKQNQIFPGHIHVFDQGKISEFCKLNSNILSVEIDEKLLNENINHEKEESTNYCWQVYNETISRLLLRIQGYQHGGSIIITSNLKDDLKIKYGLKYTRLTSAIINYICSTIETLNTAESTFELDIAENSAQTVKEMFLEARSIYDEFLDITSELTGAIRFVSSLSCVDGAVVLSPELGVHGFGAVIESKPCPETIYISKYSVINSGFITEQDTTHFGTRHQSMFAYCWNNPESLGFVISQDGDIRAIMRVVDKLYMWENIKVHQFIRSNRLKRNLGFKK